MNINQLLRGITNSSQTADVKALELKVGQVVKGIVLQLLAEPDAMINIGGVPIRARLETPLQVGQMTLLQVQPESNTGQVVLKPLGASNVQILETSLTELVKSFGMKDTEANRTLIQQLHAASIPLDAKNIKAFQPIAAAPPSNVPVDQWIEAAIVAHKKGLPLRSEIVLPLQHAMFNKPLAQSLVQLQGALQKFMQALPQGEGESDSIALVRKLMDTVNALTTGKSINPPIATTLNEQSGKLTEHTARIPQSVLPRVLTNEGAIHMARQGGGSSLPATTSVTTGSTPMATPAPAPTTVTVNATTSANAQPTAIVATHVPVSSPITSPTTAQTATVTVEQTQPVASKQDTTRLSANTLASTGVLNNDQIQQTTTQQATDQEDGPWIKNLLKQLGVDYEHRTASALTQTTDLPDIDDLQFRHESVKGLLLQLASSEDFPNALKESMQQVVQQITGQQLLLGGERGSPFSLVTLFVPIQHENGTDTASVHIQSKRKQGGNLDADNCRLLFDLSMTTLGNTLLDVQVVNRIVSLQVHNDFPMISELLDTLRPEIEAAMKQIGFQFISMKHLPYPDPTTGRSSDANSSPEARSSVSTTYHSKPYKGVDFRI